MPRSQNGFKALIWPGYGLVCPAKFQHAKHAKMPQKSEKKKVKKVVEATTPPATPETQATPDAPATTKAKKKKYYNMMYSQKLSHLPAAIQGKDDLVTIIADKLKPARYGVIIHDKEEDENGQPKEADIHAMLCFANARYISAIAKAIGDKEQYVQIWDENADNGFAYLIHRTKKAKSEGKHEYDPSEVEANFDYIGYMAQMEAKQTRTENGLTPKEMLDLLYTGAMTKKEVEDRLTGSQYGQYRRQIEDVHAKRLKTMADEWRAEMQAQGRKVTVIWLYGSAGTGKTALAREYAEKVGQPYYISGSSRDPFQNYEGQHTLILDELRPKVIPYQDLLRILDPYGTQVMAPSRYSDKALACDTIIITSPYNPLHYYWNVMDIGKKRGQDTSVQSVDTVDQLIRRLELIIKIDHDSIVALEYDKDTADEETARRSVSKNMNRSECAFTQMSGTKTENPYAKKYGQKDNSEAVSLYKSIIGRQPSDDTSPQETPEKVTS